jgi:hypothetical protein
MPVTITGGKYALATVSAATETTVTVSAATFVSGDFGKNARIIGIWTSAGAFRGMAYIRRFVSTTQLELEAAVFDPVTGQTVTVIAGDTLLVSKNWAECVTTGLTVDGERVTYNAASTEANYMIWGTAGDERSLCFYDEGKSVRFLSPFLGNAYAFCEVAGGLFVQGHLADFAQNIVYGSCDWTMRNAASSNLLYGPSFLYPSSVAAHIALYGNRFRLSTDVALGSNTYSVIGNKFGVNNSSAGSYILKACEFLDVMPTTNGYGLVWQNNAQRHVSDSNTHVNFMVLAAQVGNTVYRGGFFKLRQATSIALGAVGVDGSGTWAFGADTDKRLIVSDVSSAAIWRTYLDPSSSTVAMQNVVTYDFRAGKNAVLPLVSATNTTLNFTFKDSFRNLQDATACAAILDSNWSLVDSGTSVGSASSVPLSILYRRAVGFTTTLTNSAWTFRVRDYGYDEIEQTAAPLNVSLGAAGTGVNVSFGGVQNQVPRTTLPAQATADAVTGVTVTDHGASPVTWNGFTWSITITGDLSVNSGLTAELLWAHVKSQISKTATWGGKSGILWHVLVDENPSGSGYISQRGRSGGAGATLKGVRVVDQTGNPFPGFVSFTADSGAAYILPVSSSFTLTGLQVGTEVHIYRVSDDFELAGIEATAGTTFSYSFFWTANVPIYVTIIKPGFRWIRINGESLTSVAQSFPIFQQADPTYNNPP